MKGMKSSGTGQLFPQVICVKLIFYLCLSSETSISYGFESILPGSTIAVYFWGFTSRNRLCLCYRRKRIRERKADAFIFGVKKFHIDNNPLSAILKELSHARPLAVARLQRWGLLLSAHNYQLMHKRVKSLRSGCLSNSWKRKAQATVSNIKSLFGCSISGIFTPPLK